MTSIIGGSKKGAQGAPASPVRPKKRKRKGKEDRKKKAGGTEGIRRRNDAYLRQLSITKLTRTAYQVLQNFENFIGPPPPVDVSRSAYDISAVSIAYLRSYLILDLDRILSKVNQSPGIKLGISICFNENVYINVIIVSNLQNMQTHKETSS